MSSVNDISIRFMKVYDSLIENRQISDKKDFASQIGISSSMVTEISKGRSNVGVSAIQNIVIKFNISPDWLITGKGSMLKDQPDALSLASEPQVQYGRQNDEIEYLKKIIENQQKIIEKQLNIIEAYEKGKEDVIPTPKKGVG